MQDLFHFPLGFAFYNIRWWLQEVRAVLIGFFVRREKGGVEDIMDFPCDREFELISDVQYLGDYLEGSVSPW